jgi:hypothetical protein
MILKLEEQNATPTPEPTVTLSLVRDGRNIELCATDENEDLWRILRVNSDGTITLASDVPSILGFQLDRAKDTVIVNEESF